MILFNSHNIVIKIILLIILKFTEIWRMPNGVILLSNITVLNIFLIIFEFINNVLKYRKNCLKWYLSFRLTKIMIREKTLELTLAVLKPHVVKLPHAVQDIREKILKGGFYVLKTKQIILSQLQAENFYNEHKEKFFFKRLTTFMSSGPCDVHILAKNNAIIDWRKLMGPTKVYQSQFSHPETIRGCYGLSDTRNAVHGSDSPNTALREINFFFPDFDINKWLSEEQQYFCTNAVKFIEDDFIHIATRLNCVKGINL